MTHSEHMTPSDDRLERHVALPRTSLARHISYWLALGAAAFVGMTALVWWLLGAPDFAAPDGLQRQQDLDLIKIALTLTGGIGGVIFLVVAYRKQHFGEIAEQRENAASRREDIKLLTERFMKAAEQLGHVTPTVRLAGVYAMSDLADEWIERRQTCIDVLCAHIRMHYDPTPPGSPVDRQYWHGERQVRQTIFRVIAAHLREESRVPWQGHDFDFAGAVIDSADFHEIRISSGTVTFKGAVFPSGKVEFDGAVLSGGVIDFSNATFSGGEVDFGTAKLAGTILHFFEAKLDDGHLDFSYARLTEGKVNFDDMSLNGGRLSFNGAIFSGGNAGFDCSEFKGTYVDFRRTRFSDGHLAFGDCVFSRGTVAFGQAEFAGGYVGIHRSVWEDGTVDLSNPKSWRVRPVITTLRSQEGNAGLRLPSDVERQAASATESTTHSPADA